MVNEDLTLKFISNFQSTKNLFMCSIFAENSIDLLLQAMINKFYRNDKVIGNIWQAIAYCAQLQEEGSRLEKVLLKKVQKNTLYQMYKDYLNTEPITGYGRAI